GVDYGGLRATGSRRDCTRRTAMTNAGSIEQEEHLISVRAQVDGRRRLLEAARSISSDAHHGAGQEILTSGTAREQRWCNRRNFHIGCCNHPASRGYDGYCSSGGYCFRDEVVDLLGGCIQKGHAPLFSAAVNQRDG